MADVFSPYQIDYSVKNTSKTFGFSKKKVTFKFGVANPSAVDSGAAGADCRGSEHEVIFTWSLNSGKRQILADGKDVHYSETGLNGWTADQVFQHHFNIRIAGLAGPLRAHLITQPQNRDVPHIKPFDLRINGISYFSMPKIFELGSQQMITRPVKGKGRNRGGGGGGGGGRESDAYLSHEEKQAIAAAKLASLRDINHSQNQQYSSTGFAAAPVNDATEDLLNFDSPPAPVAPPQVQGGAPYGQPPPQSYSNYSLGTSMTGGSVQPSQYPSRGSFASVPSQQQQPPPPQQQFQQNFAGSFNYGDPTTAPVPTQQPPPPQQQQQQMVQSQQGSFYGQQQQQPPPPALMYGQQQQQQPTSLASAPFHNAQVPLASPSNQTQMSYQSYGSAPSFAQPPRQQQMQQQQPSYYGQAPPNQGYP